MRNRTPSILLITVILAGACAPAIQSPAASPTAIVLVTPPADATATPTPFRPLLVTETPSPIPLQFQDTATPLPSATPPPDTPQPSVTPQTGTPLPTFVAPQNAPTPFPLLTDDETVTFLLLGSDKRPGSGYRTDTIVIAALRPTSGQVTLISVPRDLWVYIPGWGMNKINTAYQHGELTVKGSGPATLANTILYNLGIRIDHTAMVDFDGFRRIVDTLGGIDVPVYCAYTDWRLIAPNLDQYNENNWALYTVGPGLVHMDGDLALWYARSRMKSNDYDRGRRQQEALRAIYSRALSTDTIARIPQLYSDLSSTITTDLGLTDLLGLAPLALHLNNADIRSYYIRPPLLTGMINSQGIYIQIMDGPAVQAMLQKALAPSERAPGTESLLIEVWNGSAYDGWDALAAERLNYTGYATRLAPADRRDYASSLLYDLTPDQDPARAASLLAILGLPQPALVSAPRADSSISYVLILGADYKPCFKPETLSP